MKLLVLGGTHGNELLGIQLVESLKKAPIPGVDVMVANPRAVRAKTRYVETDLNRSFGSVAPDSYEERRAAELSEITRQYDIVLDFHNTETPNNNTCFVGQDCDASLFTVAKQLKFTNCIEATYDCINKYCQNVISIEISIGDELDSVPYWRKAICQLYDRKAPDGSIEVYRYLRRVTWQEKNSVLEGRLLRALIPLAADEKQVLNVSGEVCPIFVGSRLTEFYATLITKVGER